MRALERCVGDEDAFLRDAWTRRPHLHRAGADAYADLLTLDDVDRILTTTSPRPPTFRLVRAGRPLPAASYTRSGTVGGRRLHDLPDVGRVMAHFDDGATIVLQGLHRYWEPVTRFCRDLETVLTHPVQANAYLTPPVSSGLDVHHDTHDVFALQTHGRKHWTTYAPVVEQPLPDQRWRPELGEPGAPTLDLHLEPGDCLYVPRGTLHAARTVAAASLHLTIGVRAITWHELFGLVAAEAADDPVFREALPAGFADDPAALAPTVAARLKDLAAWVEERDGEALAERLARRFWAGRQPDLRGQVAQLLDARALTPDSVLRRRVANPARLRTDGDRAVVELGDRSVRFPARLAPVLRRVLDADRFTVGDLHELDPESRLVLARRLVREGLFTVARG